MLNTKEQLTDEEVIGALPDNLGYVALSEKNMPFIGLDMIGAPDLNKFMKLVISTEQVPFITRDEGMPCQAKRASRLADYFPIVSNFVTLYHPSLDYCPGWQLFFDCYREHLIHEFQVPYGPNLKVANTDTTYADVFNDFVSFLRGKAKERRTGVLMSERKRGPRKNAERLKVYVDGLFARYSRLLVVRVDLHPRAPIDEHSPQLKQAIETLAKEITQGQIGLMKGRHEVLNMEAFDPKRDPVAAMNLLAKFVAEFRRNPTFADMVGYVRKTEWTPFAGYHHHFAFFFEEAKVQSDFHKGQSIGKCWEDVTGNGYFFNCNADLRRYRRVGIGKVAAHDQEKREALNEALSYLVKAEQFASVKHTYKGRMFQTGVLKPLNGKKRGRPRKLRSMVLS